MANKVEFGLNFLYFGTYEVADNGTVTLGTPVRVPGARKFTPEESSERSTIDGDDVTYWAGYSGGTEEGDVEVVLFPDSFKETFLGDARTADGGLAHVKNAEKPDVYMMFEIKGDSEKRRVIYYNGSLGAIKREYNTLEDGKKEPATESIPVTFVGDNATGITKVTYKPTDDGYSTLFTNPPVPALASDES